MKVFILDDMATRIESFSKKHQTDSVTSATTANEAISIFEKDLEWDLISLDHDLGGQVFCSSELENSGYRVAKYLSDKNVKGRIVIHSWNPVGAKNMMNILPTAVYQPFSA